MTAGLGMCGAHISSPQEQRIPTLFVDKRNVGAVTVRNPYPILRMDEGINWSGKALIFLTIDAKYHLWQVDIDDSDREKTSFM